MPATSRWFCAGLVMALLASAPRAGCGATKPGPDDKDAPKEFTKTKSGLMYRILRKSEGRKPTALDTVTVHYRGWLDSGKDFDNSYKGGEPITFPLTKVIPGWTEGLQLVGEGGKIELLIPSEIGYGTRGDAQGGIPPNAMLHFSIELIKVSNSPPPESDSK
jgi:FKBP-type peptidyl-prolyl cis-trans isomerase FkpA